LSPLLERFLILVGPDATGGKTSKLRLSEVASTR